MMLKMVVFFTLLVAAITTYWVMRKLGFTVDQALVAALIDTVCMIGSWHP